MAFLTGGMNLVGAATPLIVIVLAKQLGASDIEIGVIFSIGGIGGILGSLVGGQIQKRFSFGQVIVAVSWALALLFPLYLLVPKFALLGVVYALIYLTGPIYNVVQFSYRLALIPDALQGRVNSTFRLLAFGFIPVGAAVSGFLLEHDRHRAGGRRVRRAVSRPGGDDDLQPACPRGPPAGQRLPPIRRRPESARARQGRST